MASRRQRELDDALRDALDATLPVADPDYYAMQRGVALADFECRHDALPHDAHVTCDCWTAAGAPDTERNHRWNRST